MLYTPLGIAGGVVSSSDTTRLSQESVFISQPYIASRIIGIKQKVSLLVLLVNILVFPPSLKIAKTIVFSTGQLH
jgi:hypothetical protein